MRHLMSGSAPPTPRRHTRLAGRQDRTGGAEAAQEMSQNIRGILFLLAGIAVFSLQDLILKLLSGAYPLHEAMVVRSIAAIPFLLLIAHRDGGLGTLLSPGRGQMLGRGVMNFLAYTSYYLALAALPIATTVTLYFTAPFFITALSILFLGERVTALRWITLLGGFAGVLVVMRPGGEAFSWAMVLPVFASFFYAAAMIVARRIGGQETATAMAFYSNLTFLIGALALAAVFGSGAHADESQKSMAFLLRGWTVPPAADLALMAACGLIAAVGLTLLTQAYRIGQANAVAPFEYSALFWGLMSGWLVWGDWPDRPTWAGIAMLVGAGLVLLYSERRNPTEEPAA